MRTKAAFTLAAILLSSLAFAQQDNYVLYINGDSVSISLNQPQTVQTGSGRLQLVLKQKEIMTFSDALYSFQYPGNYTVTAAKIDKDIEQVMTLSAMGNGILIQKYKTVNPELIQDLMLSEMTEESRAAGYTEKLENIEQKLGDGRVLKGKRSTLTLDDEKNIYTVYPVKVKNGGLLIVTLLTAPDEAADIALINTFWKTLKITE